MSGSRMNYGLLLLSFLICGIGLYLGVALFQPIGFVFDGLGFMLFLYVLYTSKHDEGTERRPRYQVYNEPIDDGHVTWVCPDCKTSNWSDAASCIHCGRTKP